MIYQEVSKSEFVHILQKDSYNSFAHCTEACEKLYNYYNDGLDWELDAIKIRCDWTLYASLGDYIYENEGTDVGDKLENAGTFYEKELGRWIFENPDNRAKAFEILSDDYEVIELPEYGHSAFLVKE